MSFDPDDLLRRRGVRLTAPRRAIAAFLLSAPRHLTAEEILHGVKSTRPAVSRATIYNTLELFVRHGLVRCQLLKPGVHVYDTVAAAHHHFIDEATGEITDIPSEDIALRFRRRPRGLVIDEITVVIRGRKKAGEKAKVSR